MMEKFTSYQVVKKLVGRIDPEGETNTDNLRFENLKEMTRVVDGLLFDIEAVAIGNKGRPEYSRKRAGEYASKFLDDVRDAT